MSGDDYIKWLNPSSDPSDSHAAAICFSANDAGSLITALEVTCTQLKNYCTLEMKTQIMNLRSIQKQNWFRLRNFKVNHNYEEQDNHN